MNDIEARPNTIGPEILQVRRDVLQSLEDTIEALPRIELPLKHHFAKGVYIREILIPGGAVVLGKIHATEHFNIILQGECTVLTVAGRDHYKAPETFVSDAGVQKAVLAITDTIWQTVHVTDKTDPDEIVEELTVKEYNQLELDSLLEQVGRLT